jgi:hypothetical protein
MSVNILNEKPEERSNWELKSRCENIEELILNKEIMDNIETCLNGLYGTR